MKIEHKQQSYRWSGSGWLDHYGLQVSRKLSAELNRRFLENWWLNHERGDERKVARPPAPQEGDCSSQSTLRLVEMLARRYLASHEFDAAILAVLCAALRGQSQQALALQVGLNLVPEGPGALRSTLVGSLRDLGRWDEARDLLRGPGPAALLASAS